MGYWATGDGWIEFAGDVSDAKQYEIKKRLEETFESVSCYGCETDKTTREKVTAFEVEADDKYYESEVQDTLNAVSLMAPVKAGEICYCGEDDAF